VNLEEALTNELRSISELTNKVFLLRATENTKAPYLVYSLSSNNRNQNLNGYDGLLEGRYQLDVYNSTYANLKALLKLVIAKIKTFSQRVIGSSGPYIQQIIIENEFETYENNVLLFKGIVEIKIFYNE
jgi:hypothetical protein